MQGGIGMHVVTRNCDMSSQLMNVNNISAPARGVFMSSGAGQLPCQTAIHSLVLQEKIHHWA